MLTVRRRKRWLIFIAAVVIALVSAGAVRSHLKTVAREKRERGYQVALRTYSQALSPGLTRTEVERYLHAKDADFFVEFGPFGGSYGSADLLRMGQETAPWYCSEQDVYLAFEFSDAEKDKQNASDVLEKVEIYRQYEGCL